MTDPDHLAIDVSQIQMVLADTVKPVFPRNMVIGHRYKITFANLVFGKSINEFYGTLVQNDTNGIIYFNEVSYFQNLSKRVNGLEIIPLYTTNYLFYAV